MKRKVDFDEIAAGGIVGFTILFLGVLGYYQKRYEQRQAEIRKIEQIKNAEIRKRQAEEKRKLDEAYVKLLLMSLDQPGPLPLLPFWPWVNPW